MKLEVSPFKIIKYERYLLALIMTFLMFLFASFTNNKDIIFPEILAILTGAWMSKKMLWNVNKRRIFILTTIAAFWGVFVVNYFHYPLFFQVMLSFLFTGFILVIAKSDFIPVSSACILPVYFQIETYDYSVAVSIMTSVIILFQWLMEKYKMKTKNSYNDNIDIVKSIKNWLYLFVIFAIVSLIPLTSVHIFFLVPPLIVTFVAFSNVDNSIRTRPLAIVCLLTLVAAIGSSVRMLLNINSGLPLAICAVIAVVLLFIVFDYTRLLFPPAGAILLLPMIIDAKELKYFPLEVMVGSSILVFVAISLFRKKSI